MLHPNINRPQNAKAITKFLTDSCSNNSFSVMGLEHNTLTSGLSFEGARSTLSITLKSLYMITDTIIQAGICPIIGLTSSVLCMDHDIQNHNNCAYGNH